MCSDSHSRLFNPSPPILPLLDLVHGLRDLCPGVFLHGRPQTLPRRLRLDPGPDPEPAGLHHRESPEHLRLQQHRRDQNDPQPAAGLR